MLERIWLSLAHMSGREQGFIQEAFDTNWVVPLGPNVNAFEKSLRDFLIENGELKIENVLQKSHFQFSTSSFQFTEIESGKAPAEWP